MSLQIKVPATTANLGAGFDSVGVALNLYLTIDVQPANEWSFISHSQYLDLIPTDQDNLIYQIAKQTANRYSDQKLPACRVELTSDIPLARGLGSSATAIVAGIELANQLLSLNLTSQEKVLWATEIEGHPDNVAPATLGGCVIGHYDNALDMIRVELKSDLVFLAMIPPFELKTKEARAVLPKSFTFEDGVQASSIANVSIAAICQGDWALLGQMMKKDKFHQPYRKALIPHYQQLEGILTDHVYGTYLSGAGPTMIALASRHVISDHLSEWQRQYNDFDWCILEPDHSGVQVQLQNMKV
ncbi:homoserine kinase [Amphibacillus sediminis]|uniref:homoserine kinase n=1 Tax=Amphibacillus sediminis TaxID=360185 RepID=UPI00083204B0|nr:homoserine kinase [Amphibacillus sediminis]